MGAMPSDSPTPIPSLRPSLPEPPQEPPTLRVRVARVPDGHPAAGVALPDLLPDLGDVLAWLGERARLVGWGQALRLDVEGRHALRSAARAWDDIRRRAIVEDASSDGAPPRDASLAAPVALGSFGFAWATPGLLVVPEVLVIEDEGGRRVVTASTSGRPPEPLAALEESLRRRQAHPVAAPAGLWTQTGRMTQNQWMESVRRLIGRLRGGAASKVVMSRDMVVSAARPVDHRHLLSRLHALYPTTWAYAVGGLVGATPEMLASMHDGRVTSRVLAGTLAPGQGERLMASLKDRTEHMLAVESVARALAPIAETLDVPDRPSVLDLPNVSHLATEVTATLRTENVLDVVAALHPTAAVCGTPTALALDLLDTFESTRRGRYSGPVGWIDATGEGEFGIALRCGQIADDGLSVRVFAGGGIMPDSVPEVELAETRAKMAPVLQALGVEQG